MAKKIKQLFQNLEIRVLTVLLDIVFFPRKRNIKNRNVLIDVIKATLKAMHNFHNTPSYKTQ